MAEEKREHGCLSLLLGLLFILLILTLLFGWDIDGKHYGIGFTDNGLRLIWGEPKEGDIGDKKVETDTGSGTVNHDPTVEDSKY